MSWELLVWLLTIFFIFFLWHLFFNSRREYVLLCWLLMITLFCSVWLYLLNSRFLAFVSYMAAVAGVLILICYCVALIPFDIREDMREPEKQSLEVRNRKRIYAGLGILLFCVVVEVFFFIEAGGSWEFLVGWADRLGSLLTVLRKWNVIPGCHWGLYICIYWCYFMVFLSAHLFVVIVGCVNIIDSHKGSLVRRVSKKEKTRRNF